VFTEAPALPWVLVSAVISARARELDGARFWRDTAHYWHGAAANCETNDANAWAGRRWAS
jgi:uncharacterized membrane protein